MISLQGNPSEQISMGKPGSGLGQEGHQDWKTGDYDNDFGDDDDCDSDYDSDDDMKITTMMVMVTIFLLNNDSDNGHEEWGYEECELSQQIGASCFGQLESLRDSFFRLGREQLTPHQAPGTTRGIHCMKHDTPIFSSDRSSYTDDGPQYIRGTSFFRFSLSPLVQLMLQVSL